jgi:hypothetical protein
MLLSSARTPEMSGADERYFGGGEVIGIEAAAAEMGAAPSGVDVAEHTKSCVHVREE